MSERRVTIKIDPMGNPTVEGHGFAGQSCAEATQAIEEALSSGGGEMSRTYKDTWHESENVATEQEVSQGW